MNVIVIVLDSFRQDHIGFYNNGQAPFPGVEACKTPNIDAFAREAVVFDNAYPEALPTMPVRMQLMTGQRTLPCRSWEPLAPQDVAVAKILSDEGYVCGLVSDVYHFRAPGMNYHRNFAAYRWIRGQEYDPWVSAPTKRDINDYVNESFPEVWRRRIAQFLANTDGFEAEADWFPAKVVDESVDWLEGNRPHDKKLLWIESFDPHEPWDPPARFDTYTDAAYSGPRLIMPMGGITADWATPEEATFVRGLYAGEAAFVDDCLGRLFGKLQDLGYYDDSVILLVADHGHPLGDHGKFLKGADRMYSELLKVPFMIRLPKGECGGHRASAIVQFHDALPTLLEIIGHGNATDAMAGRSFLPVLKGDTDEHRESMITGYHRGVDRCVRDKTWSYILRPDGEPDELYNLIDDPKEKNNLIDQNPDEALRLASAFGDQYRQLRNQPPVDHTQAGSTAGGKASAVVVKGVQGEYEMASSAID